MILGKTNVPPIWRSGIDECGLRADDNPWDPAARRGEAQGASAAAIAAGLKRARGRALDIGGSIRVPAALLRRLRPPAERDAAAEERPVPVAADAERRTGDGRAGPDRAQRGGPGAGARPSWPVRRPARTSRGAWSFRRRGASGSPTFASPCCLRSPGSPWTIGSRPRSTMWRRASPGRVAWSSACSRRGSPTGRSTISSTARSSS